MVAKSGLETAFDAKIQITSVFQNKASSKSRKGELHSSIDSSNSLLTEEIFASAFNNATSPQARKEKGGDGPSSPECAINSSLVGFGAQAQDSTRDEVSFQSSSAHRVSEHSPQAPHMQAQASMVSPFKPIM